MLVWNDEVYMDVSRGYRSFSKGFKQQRKTLNFQNGSTVAIHALGIWMFLKNKSDDQNPTQYFALSFLGSVRNYMKRKFIKNVQNDMFLNTMCHL